MTTKEAIIYESLKLFSENGYEAVSTRAIAKAVGASDAVIYKHFKSKKDILDTIIEECKERYQAKAAGVKVDKIDWKNIEEICMGMFRFQTQDEWIVCFRKLLIVEQFKNPEMKQLYKAFFIDAPLQRMKEIFEILIEQGYMKKGNPYTYAIELYAPFFMFHTVGGTNEELLEALEEHVVNFRYSVISDVKFLDIDEKYRRN